VGLASFNKSLLGSPSSAQRSLNILTTFGILIYFGIAVQLNLINVLSYFVKVQSTIYLI
jgi:hypothetical protein